MGNLDIYNNLRSVPKEAQRAIAAGRLKGKTDINPMWRIKALTEQFGVCGVGWKTNIKRFWLEHGANDEVSAFCEIELFVKTADGWSDGIPGIGGSAFVATERNGLYTSDECFKMAFTDAISVAAKMLGVGADVYWSEAGTKYSKSSESKQDNKTPVQSENTAKLTDERRKELLKIYSGDESRIDAIVDYIKKIYKDNNMEFGLMTEDEWLIIKAKAEKAVAKNGGDT